MWYNPGQYPPPRQPFFAQAPPPQPPPAQPVHWGRLGPGLQQHAGPPMDSTVNAFGRPHFPSHYADSFPPQKRARLDPNPSPPTFQQGFGRGFESSASEQVDRRIAHEASMKMALYLQLHSPQSISRQAAVSPPRTPPLPSLDSQKNQDILEKTMMENADLKNRCDDLQKEIGRLRESAEKANVLQLKLIESEKKLNDVCDTFTERVDKLGATITQQEQKITSLKNDNAKLQNKCRSVTELSKLSPKNLELADAYSRRLEQWEAELGNARKELADLRDAKSALQRQKDAMTKNVVALTRERDHWKTEYELLGESRGVGAPELEKKLKAVEVDNTATLKQELEKERQRSKELKDHWDQRVEQFKAELVRQTTKNDQMKRERDDFKTKYEASIKTQSAMEKDLSDTKNKLEIANSGNSALGKELRRFKILGSKLPLFKSIIKRLRREKEVLKTQTKSDMAKVHEEVEKNFNAALEKASVFLKASNANVESLRKEIEVRVADLSSMEQKFNVAVLAENTLKEELEKKLARINKLEEALRVSDSALNMANKCIESTRADLAKNQGDLKQQLESQSLLKQQLSTMKQEYDQAKRDLQKNGEALNAAIEAEKKAQGELKKTVAELDALKKKPEFRPIKKEPQETDEIIQLRKLADEYKKKYEEATGKVDHLSNTIQVNQTELALMQTKVAKVESQCTELKKSIRDLRAANDDFKQEKDQAILRALNLEQTNQSHLETALQLRAEKDKLQKIVDETAAQMRQLEEKKKFHEVVYVQALGKAASFQNRVEEFVSHVEPAAKEEMSQLVHRVLTAVVTAFSDAHNAEVAKMKKEEPK